MANTLKYKKGDYISFHQLSFLPETIGKIDYILKQGTWIQIRVKLLNGMNVYLYKNDEFKIISKEEYFMEIL